MCEKIIVRQKDFHNENEKQMLHYLPTYTGMTYQINRHTRLNVTLLA